MSWLAASRRRHLLWMAPLTGAVAAASALGWSISAERQIALLAVAVAVFGLPHGALDHLVGRRLLRPELGGRWPLVFFPAYLVLAAAVVAAWWAAPRLMLALFLLYSAWHFGAGDLEPDSEPATDASERTRDPRLPAARHGLVAFCRGLLPIALPGLFHPAEVAVAFNWLLPDRAAVAPEGVAWLSGLALAVGGALAVAALGGAAFARRLRRSELWLELAALGSLFALAPPLVAFLVYFCGWHSVRHLLELGWEIEPEDPRRAAVRLAGWAWPLTALTIVAAIPAWWLLYQAGVDPSTALAQVVFIGLAALTVPHMALGSLAARRDASREISP